MNIPQKANWLYLHDNICEYTHSYNKTTSNTEIKNGCCFRAICAVCVNEYAWLRDCSTYGIFCMWVNMFACMLNFFPTTHINTEFICIFQSMTIRISVHEGLFKYNAIVHVFVSSLFCSFVRKTITYMKEAATKWTTTCDHQSIGHR